MSLSTTVWGSLVCESLNKFRNRRKFFDRIKQIEYQLRFSFDLYTKRVFLKHTLQTSSPPSTITYTTFYIYIFLLFTFKRKRKLIIKESSNKTWEPFVNLFLCSKSSKKIFSKIRLSPSVNLTTMPLLLTLIIFQFRFIIIIIITH